MMFLSSYILNIQYNIEKKDKIIVFITSKDKIINYEEIHGIFSIQDIQYIVLLHLDYIEDDIKIKNSDNDKHIHIKIPYFLYSTIRNKYEVCIDAFIKFNGFVL